MTKLNKKTEVTTVIEVGSTGKATTLKEKINEILFTAYHLGRECTHLSAAETQGELDDLAKKLEGDIFSLRVQATLKKRQEQVEEFRTSLLRYLPNLPEREVHGYSSMSRKSTLPLIQETLIDVLAEREYEVRESPDGKWFLTWAGEVKIGDVSVEVQFVASFEKGVRIDIS